ncbi:UDP-glucose 4-epimerase-like [Schistocerca gregaria]|uniref:UDP-glucose 4-epimerase-like n=1 Tax=Schistocerca gregaria TaxID=7010 RepID=UPI00211E9B7E|nr:UDP-glucose 4-epimerase-like [Schistocerca gregaria]
MDRIKKILSTNLVTGGIGFIGSHVAAVFLEAGYEVLIIDKSSKKRGIQHIKDIVGLSEKSKKLLFFQIDMLNYDALLEVFLSNTDIDAVIHLAGLKSVAKSNFCPLLYYQNNLVSSINLLRVMEDTGVNKLLFSSSAFVYEESDTQISENAKLMPKTPYASSKAMIEKIMSDVQKSAPEYWHIGCMRYFNPVGAHQSGKIGEEVTNESCNLVPIIAQVAAGEKQCVTIFGDDYETRDGTTIRDYVHITDLAYGHISALKKIAEKPTYCVYNIGTGIGTSVIEMIKFFEKVSGCKIPYKIGKRREGDLKMLVADPSKSLAELNLKCEKSVLEMCADFWKWKQIGEKDI